jgi:hypothetical protein
MRTKKIVLYRMLNRLMVISVCFLLALAGWGLLASGGAWAQGKPARTETLAAGPYIIDVNLYQDPPYTDQPLQIGVVPHDSTLRLSGQIVAQPGLGTDATELRAKLTPTDDGHGTLEGTISLPVQGAWHLVIQLDGPRGSGSEGLDVTVGAPGAMPAWLAWLIGSSPLVGIALWIWHQHEYRRRLLLKQGE